MLLILAHKRQRHGNIYGFKASLVHIKKILGQPKLQGETLSQKEKKSYKRILNVFVIKMITVDAN